MSAILSDGHGVVVTFPLMASGLYFKEVEVKPPGMDGGGENDTTTMRNTLYRTKQPKQLVTMTPMSMTASYDPAFYTEITDMINQNQLINTLFPDGSQLDFWGWVDKFEPDNMVEGSPPRATVTIVPSNQNNSGVETAPVYTPAA